MATINPYLNFPGTTEEAFLFYQSVFGGDFPQGIMRFKDTPEAEKTPAADLDKVMHVGLPVGKTSVLMATDVTGSMGDTLIVGNNISLSLSADSEAEADKLFNGLAAGGTIRMPMQKTFWGSYFGMLTDRFEIQWMVSYDAPPQ